jgi:hypothetical protein
VGGGQIRSTEMVPIVWTESPMVEGRGRSVQPDPVNLTNAAVSLSAVWKRWSAVLCRARRNTVID